MIISDVSGQASAELILLMVGVIAVVLISLTMYKDYLIDFSTEIDTQVNNLTTKIDNIKFLIK